MWFLIGMLVGWYVCRVGGHLVLDTLWVLKQRRLHSRRIAIVNADGCYVWCACAPCKAITDFPKMIGMSTRGVITAKSYRWEAAEECDHPGPCLPESIPPSANRERNRKEHV